jgi:predicted nucleotide-binding protein
MDYSNRLHHLTATAPRGARTPDDPEFVGWKRDCEALIKRIYGADSSEFADFRNLRFEWRGPITALHGPGAPKLFQESIDQALALLSSFMREQLDAEQTAALKAAPEEWTNHVKADKRSVFVVHGHNGELKQGVARLLSRFGLNPVILHEQADQGRTIIEKFEAHSTVGFAVILMTGDDEGRKCGSPTLNKRARQNVIFECGYFVGKLGRSRVMTLVEDGLETFSDYAGVVFTPVDEAGAWMTRLARELKAAGYAVDMNLL